MGEVSLPGGRVRAGAILAGLGEVENLLEAAAQQRGRRSLGAPDWAERAEDVFDLDLVDRKIPEHGQDVVGERALKVERPLAAAPAGAMGSEIFGHDHPEGNAAALSHSRAHRRLATQKLRPQRPRLLTRLLEAHRVQRPQPELRALAGTVVLEDPG